MRGWVASLVIVVALVATRAVAQDTATDEAPAVQTQVPVVDTPATEATETTLAEPSTVSPSPAEPAESPPTRTAPRAAVYVPAPYDPERPVPATPSHPSEPTVEIALAINGGLGLGTTSTGLGALGALSGGSISPSISTNADLAVALGTRAWLGLGLSITYQDRHVDPTSSSSVTPGTSWSGAIPLILQFYLDEPRVGAAVPTLRVYLAGTWSEQPAGTTFTGGVPMTTSVRYAGAQASLLGGVTWMGASWIALRILGGLTGGVSAAYSGPENVLGNVAIVALVSAVIRM